MVTRRTSVRIAAGLLASTTAFAQAARPARTHYVFVSTFLNHGGDPDDAWLGLALQFTLLLKLSYVQGLTFPYYNQRLPTPPASYDVPERGLELSVWAEQLRARYNEVITGLFVRDGPGLSIQVWLCQRRTEPRQVARVEGSLDEMPALLDETVPNILRALYVPSAAGRPWEGKAMTPSTDALEWFSRGMLAYADSYDEAALHFMSALDDDPDFIEAHWMMGQVARRQRELPVALEHFDRVVAAIPDSGQAHFSLANVLLLLGRQEAAIDEYKATVRLDPRYREPVDASIIRAYQRNNQLDEALAWGEQSLAEAPDNVSVLVAVGQVHQQMGAHEKAIDCYQRAVTAAKKPNAGGYVPRVYESIAQCYEALGKLDEAAKQYTLGLETASDSEALFLRQALARIRERQGDTAAALREWQTVLQLAPPGSGPAVEAENKLKELRAH